MKIQIVNDKGEKSNSDVMLKCHFCKECSPKGKCRWSMDSIRTDKCKVAIATMVRALQS